MMRHRPLMPVLLCTLVLYCCSDSSTEPMPETGPEWSTLVHGFWRASAGDTVRNGPAILVYDWYAFDVVRADSIAVYYDSGDNCTVSHGLLDEHGQVGFVDWGSGFHVTVDFAADTTATARFMRHDGKVWYKTLFKTRDDARVACF